MEEEDLKQGEIIYRTFCSACHQIDGTGNPGMYPPLNSKERIEGDPKWLIDVVLKGLKGEIEVDGEVYDQVMIPHDFLTDQQIADVLSYIRNSFGNHAGRINPEEVSAVRSGN